MERGKSEGASQGQSENMRAISPPFLSLPAPWRQQQTGGGGKGLQVSRRPITTATAPHHHS